MNPLSSTVSRYVDGVTSLASKTGFFMVALVVFAAQALWLAYSAVYPLPFDEYYHFGIISIYADQLSPFIHHQPLEAGLYGDITRAPAYLYHYLMSFPYRIFDMFIDGERGMITALRVLNVAMVLGSAVIFRKLLLSNGVPKSITHLAITVFLFTPIVSLLAAHINYDNMLLLLVPAWLIIAMNIIRGSDNLAHNTVLFFSVGLAALLVKNSFAPFLAIVTVYLIALLINRHKDEIASLYVSSIKKTAKSARFMLSIFLLIIMTALFTERYVVNQLSYGSITPECDLVQSDKVCSNNTVWLRNQQNLENKTDQLPYGPAEFTQLWSDRMVRGYFAIFSHAPSRVVSTAEPYGPIELRGILLASLYAGLAVLVMGIIALVFQIRYIWNDKLLRFFLMSSFAYVLILFVFNTLTYIELGKPEAIQARYTLPVLIPLLTVLAVAVSRTAKQRPARLLILSTFLIYCLVGGIVGRIAWNEPAWLWPDRSVININNNLHNLTEAMQITEWREVIRD